MKTNEIKEKLRKEKNEGFIATIDYNGKSYIKSLKIEKDKIKYMYYEIEDEEIKCIENKKILDSLKEIYSPKAEDKIY